MKAYVITYTEGGVAKQFTLYASPPWRLGAFISELVDKGCDINNVELAKQAVAPDIKSEHDRVR